MVRILNHIWKAEHSLSNRCSISSRAAQKKTRWFRSGLPKAMVSPAEPLRFFLSSPFRRKALSLFSLVVCWDKLLSSVVSRYGTQTESFILWVFLGWHLYLYLGSTLSNHSHTHCCCCALKNKPVQTRICCESTEVSEQSIPALCARISCCALLRKMT